MEEFLEVRTTIDSREAADALAVAVVEARLAACVQVSGPVHSTFRWKGSIDQATEWVCTMKTTGARFKALEAFIKEQHSYETPEIVATPVVQSSREYLDWIAEET